MNERCKFHAYKTPDLFESRLVLLAAGVDLVHGLSGLPTRWRSTPFQRDILSSESSEISHFLKQAQGGDRIAQFNVASRYLQGVRVPQDYKNAGMWYERAA